MRNVSLCGFVRMMSCKKRMGMSGMRVMSRDLIMTRRVVPGCFLMVLHGLFMVLGCLYMMAVRRMVLVRCFLSHVSSPFVVSIYEIRALREGDV
jgi:hypothetical protein